MEISDKEQNSDESSDEIFITTPDIPEIDENVTDQLLPVKSRKKYEAAYITYSKWKLSKNIKLTSENVLEAYFEELSEKYKPPTLWSTWSMLKRTIKQKNGIDITKYKHLTAFLKRKSAGYKSKKSKVLSSQEVERFLNDAPENKYLATKVALIFGICGACRRDELSNVKINDVEHQGEILVVNIPNATTRIPRKFVIADEFSKIVKKYESLRPPITTSDRFFLNFQNGKCTNQVIGKNKFGAMPKQIAKYLNLPDPSLYTGHSFRRTSAALLAGIGADFTTRKRHGSYKTSTIAEAFVENSVDIKQEIEDMITSSISMDSSTSNEQIKTEVPPLEDMKEVNIVVTTSDDNIFDSTVKIDEKNPVFQFQNCNVNIHYHKS